jgi:hypothetical protein
VAQVGDYLPSKCEALSSRPSTIKRKKRIGWQVLRSSWHYTETM